MTQNSQNNIKRERVWRLTKPSFKTSSKAIVIKPMWYWWKKRQIYQWNRKPRIKQHKSSPLVFENGTTAIQMEKKKLSLQKMMIETLKTFMPKPNEFRHKSYTFYKSQLKIHPRCKCKAKELLKITYNLFDLLHKG